MPTQLINRLCLLVGICVGTMLPYLMHAQEETTYTGTVRDSLQSVASANVYIVNAQSVLLTFAITNERGEFRITLTSSLPPQPLWLEVTSLGYKKERIKIDPQKQTYAVHLLRDPVYLQGVTVANRPRLEQLGDTLRYIVSSFAQKEDRSIGDVLRRMPGIKIMEDGTIYYNDKQVDNLYIQGDDLMSGRYGTATKVIRKEMIKSVDVIQNDQPVKVLQDKVFSDKASINLVLADENSLKLSIGGNVGLGLPRLYDLSANTILLNKKYKSINLVSINNAGVDYRDQLKMQGTGNMAGSIDKDITGLTLSMLSARPPAIAQRYYYDNRSRLLNFNNLYNLKGGFQLKANLQAFSDVNYFSYKGLTQNLAGVDTIVYRDVQRATNRTEALNGSFQVFANKARFYFNNTMQYKSWRDRNSALMDFNDNPFEQSLAYRRQTISNDLHWIPRVRSKTIVELRWLLKAEQFSNQLRLYDGFVSSIEGHEGMYDNITQDVKDPVLFSNVYLSAKRSWSWGTLSQNAGWIMEDHLMQSALLFLKNGAVIPYSGDDGNYQRWRSSQYYTSTALDFKKNRWSGTLQLPLIFQQIRDRQRLYAVNNSLEKLRFNPKLTVLRQFTLEKQVSLNYSFTTTLGEFTDTYLGSVLQNYRNLSSSEGVLPFNRIHNTSVNYRYQKSIKLLSFNADLNYTNISGNTMLASSVTDSLEEVVLVQENNTQELWSANAGVSKFFFPLKLNTSLRLGYRTASGNVILNGRETTISNHAFTASLQFIKRFSDILSVDYTARGELIRVISSGAGNQHQVAPKVQTLNQTIKTSFIPGKRLLIDLVLRNAIQQNSFTTQHYFFSDAKIRYTSAKKKFDLNIEGINLFNVKNYFYLNADSYRVISNEYFLRGRMVMAKVDVYF